MSWANAAWKDELAPSVLQKVEGYEQQVNRLQKDCLQKQTQVDYLQQQLDKEKRKNEEEKGASGELMRDMRAMEVELAELAAKHSKLQHELATKDAQLRQQEGQLKASTSQPLLETAFPSTPVGRSRLQRCGYGDTPATPGYRELQNKIAELEAKLRERQDCSQPTSMLSTPLRAQSLDRSNREMDRLRNDNVQLRGQVQELERRAQKASQEMECKVHNSEAARQALEQRCRDREVELKEELRLHIQEKEQLRKELNTTQARLLQELTAATKSLDATKTQLERSEAKLLTTESLVADLRKQVSRLEQQERQSSSRMADLDRALKNQEQAAKSLEAKNANMEVKIRELEAAGESANHEARQLEAELRKSTHELEQRLQDMAQLQNLLANTKNQLLAVENQKQSLEKERSQSCTELKRESSRSQDFECQLQKAQKKVEELQQAVSQSSGVTERLRAELDRSEKCVVDCNVKIQKLESKLEDSDQREREAVQKVLTVEHNVQNLQKAAQESHALAKALREKEAEVSTLTKSKLALEGTIKQLSNDVAALSSELSDAKARVVLLEKEIADGKELVSRAGKVQKDYEEAAQHMEEIKISLENTERQKKNLQDELTGRVVECKKVPGLESALQECKAQLAKSETQVRQLEGLLSERENEKVNLLKSLLEKESALKDFQSKAEMLQRDGEQVEIELGSVKGQLLKSDGALKGHELALKEREVLLERVKKELDDTVQKVQNLQQAEAEQRQLAQEKEAEITALKQDISAEKELFKLMEQQSLSIVEIESSKSALELELASMEEKYAVLQQEHKKCLELVESKDTDVLGLRSLVQEKEAVVEELQGRLVRAEQNVSRLTEEMTREQQALEEKLSMAMSDITNLKKELDEQSELRRKFANEVESLNAMLAEQRVSNEVLLEEKKVLIFSQAALEDEIATSKRRIDELQEAHAALEGLQARLASAEENESRLTAEMSREKQALEEKLSLAMSDISNLTKELNEQTELHRKVASEVEAMNTKFAEQLALNEVLLEEKKVLTFSQVTLEDEIATSKRRIDELQEAHAMLEGLQARLASAEENESRLTAEMSREKQALEENLSLAMSDISNLKKEVNEQSELHREVASEAEAMSTKFAEQLASNEALLEEKKMLVFAQVALENEVASNKEKIKELQEECTTLRSQLSTSGAQVQALQEEMDRVLQHEVARIRGELCLKNAEIEELKSMIEGHCKKQNELEILRQQVAAASKQCSEFEQECMALRQKCEEAASRELELLNSQQVLSCQRDEERAEREALEHDLVERNMERDAGLLQLASAQSYLEQALVAATEKEARIQELEQQVTDTMVVLEAKNDETASLSEALHAAGDMLKEAQERQLKLEKQLEGREATIAALTQEVSQIKNAGAEATAVLTESLVALEGSRKDAEELRQELVERNGERDDLYMALMRLQSEMAGREQELGLALVEALEREAEAPVRLLQYLRDYDAARIRQAVPSRAGGLADPLPHIVSALFEMYYAAVSLLEDLDSALQTRHACLQEECQRLAALDPRPNEEVAATDLTLQKVSAQRQEVTERVASVKSMAEAVVQWAESSSLAERAGSSHQEQDLSLLDSTSMTFVTLKDNTVLDERASPLYEDLSHCQTEATAGYTDMTNISTCELAVSSTDSNGSEDDLVDKMAHVCSLLASLRRSLHGLLSQTLAPPHALLSSPLLSQYAQRVEEEYTALQQSVGILKGRLPNQGEQEPPHTVNVLSELRVQCDGTVEAAATVFFSPALPQSEEEEEEEAFASFDEEPGSPDSQSGQPEPGCEAESKVKQTEALRAAYATFEAKLNVFLGALAELSCKEEMRDEVSAEGEKHGEICRKLFDHIETWAALFREFFKQVKETSTQIMRILCESGPTAEQEVEQGKSFIERELAFLRELVQSAFQQRDEHEKDFRALQQSLLDKQSTIQALRQALEEQEQKTCKLQLELSSIQQTNEATEAEVKSLSQEVKANDLTIKQLNSALEEVEDALQSTVAEKQKYEESAAAFQNECARAEEEKQRVQLELMEVKDAAERALAKKSQVLADIMDAKAVSENESRRLSAEVDALLRELSEAMQSKKELEDKLEDERRQLSALKINVEHLLASNIALEKCSEALKEELKSTRAVQETQVSEIRKMCLTMDVSFTELSTVGDTGVDLAALRNALSRRQQEFNGQLQQLAEDKSGALSEIAELRERFSQIQAERERLEDDKRTLMQQAEEQEQELLNTDSLLEEKKLLQVDVERLVTKLDEMEELRARVVSLEEEKSAREAHIESLLSLQSSARQVQLQLTEREQQLAALEEEVVLLRSKESELEGARQAVSALEGDLADLKLQCANTQEELEALSDVRAKLQRVEASEAELKRHIDTLKDRNEQQARELEQLTHEVECLQASREESNGALQALRDHVAAEKEKAAALVADVTRLAAELTKCEQLLHLAQEEANRQTATQFSLERTIQLLVEEKETMTEKLQSTEEENQTLKSLLNENSELSDRLCDEFDNACQHIEQLKAQLAHLVTEQKEHEQQLAQAHGEINALSTSKSVLENEVSALLQKVDTANEGRSRAESEAQGARLLLEEKASEMRQLQNDLNRTSGQLEESRAQLVLLSTEQQEQQQELKAAQNETRNLLTLKLTLESKVSELLQMLDTAQQNCTRTQNEAQSMKLLLDEKASSLECMQTDFDAIRRELEQAKAELARSVLESQATSAEYANRQKQLESLLMSTQEEARELAAIKMSLEKKMEELTTQAVAAQKQQQHAEDEMQSLKRLTQQKDSEIQRIRSELSAAQHHLEELNNVHSALVEKASHVQSSLQNEIKVIREQLQESVKRSEELLEVSKQSDSKLQASEKNGNKLQELVASLKSRLSSSDKRQKELERKAATAMATIKRQEQEWRVLDTEAEKLRNRLAQTEAKLQQLNGSAQCVQELETALEDLRQELTEKRADSIDAWNRVSALRAELDKNKESVAWLRSRMRIYKKRISELEVPGTTADSRDEREGGSGIAAPATPALSGPPPKLQQTPVVTQLSVHAQSPSRAEFRVTVSACRDNKSASGTPAAKLFKRTLSKPASSTKSPGDRMAPATSRTTTTAIKRSLFPQTSCTQPSKPQGPQPSSKLVSASVSGMMTRNRRAAASSSRIGLPQEQAAGARTVTPTPQREIPHYTSNIRARTGLAADTRKRPQQHQQQEQQQEQQPQAEKGAPVKGVATAATPPCAKKVPANKSAPKSASGIMTRAQRASANAAKSKPESGEAQTDDCKMQ